MLNQKDAIIAVIATKDRASLLSRALESVLAQRKKPLEVYVVSDSEESSIQQEETLCKSYGFTYLRDHHSHNYAGNLNTALEEIVGKFMFDKQYDPDRLYIAFLDDDDTWSPDYLRECWNSRTEKTDIVVAGLNYHTEKGILPLSIPHNLNCESFLKGNPHIQGSNTFVRLSLLLKAGCFDENMDSTTDRDLFTRLFLLNPRFEIVDRHLVEVDASSSRKRLTTDHQGKAKSLAKFYSKYGGMMSPEVKNAFFDRAELFLGKTNEGQLKEFLVQKEQVGKQSEPVLHSESTALPKLCFAFVTMDKRYALRLLSDIASLDYPTKKVVIFANLESRSDFETLQNKSSELGLETNFLDLRTAQNRAVAGMYGQFVKENFPAKGKVRDISVSRTILQRTAFECSNDGDAVYVLDDDMQLSTLRKGQSGFYLEKADIKAFVSHYLGKADAVVGSYAGDAPLPSLSTLRTSLLDYVYAKKLCKNDLVQEEIYDMADYYYSFSDCGNTAIETPLPLVEEGTIQDTLGGKALSRPLFQKETPDFTPSRRGGNTLFFNRDLLLLPNISIKVGDVVARRGDSLWIYLALTKEYKIIGSPFALVQNRFTYDFDLKSELRKEIADIIGYAAIQSIGKNGLKSRTKFCQYFRKAVRLRTTRFAISYFRVIGLLEILGDESLRYLEDVDIIYSFIRKICEKTTSDFVEAGFEGLRSDILLEEKRQFLPKIKEFIVKKSNCKNPSLLGFGQEGAVFEAEGITYKVFYKKDGLDFIKENDAALNNIPGLPKDIRYHAEPEFDYITYSSVGDSKSYQGGYAKEIATLLMELKKRRIAISNLKKENFLVTKDGLCFIDLGRDIIPYSEQSYEAAVKRAYQMVQYASMSPSDFRVVISRSHHREDDALNFNLDVFSELAKGRHKEQVHDPVIIDLINKHHPSKLLDYGAGKCKIANFFSGKADVYVYDIDAETLRARAGKEVTIIPEIEKYHSNFDLINCNKVLCCVDGKTCDYILNQIYRLLPENGRLILSICDPFFDDVDKTETRTSGFKGNYQNSEEFGKETIYGTRREFHRPFSYYERLLQRHGFKIEQILEDKGIDTSTLNFIGEEIIFDCVKKTKAFLKDCTLLIKTNPMESNDIYESVRHIVTQLEKRDTFAERLLTIDPESVDRVRRYATDDDNKLESEIERLIADGYIDRVVKAKLPEDCGLYEKYFGIHSLEAHSSCGQGLLATLKGFESVKTRFVFQTDSDILYFNDGTGSIGKALDCLRENQAMTLSLSICKSSSSIPSFGARTEVRTCLMDLDKLHRRLPLPNKSVDGKPKLSWHRSLDLVLSPKESIRLSSNHIFFIHPENSLKKQGNIISVARMQVEREEVPTIQTQNVNLRFSKHDWYPQTSEEIVVFSRGRNTPPEKLRRLFDSLRRQQGIIFELVYFDDCSDRKASSEYARAVSLYDPFWKNHMLSFRNDVRIGSLHNFSRCYQYVCKEPKSVIVNIDNDDALIGSEALSLIKKNFDQGADVTVGNCLRLDKPLQIYGLVAFKDSWKRNGDNIWLHPKCFRRYLCEFIQDGLLKDGKYVDVSTDYAMMLPIVQNAHSPCFIEKQIYLFDISKENFQKEGVYGNNQPTLMKGWLLAKEKERASHKTVAVIGDGSVSKDSAEYRLAFDLGKALENQGYNIQNGGLGGVMEAVSAGAHSSDKYRIGSTIALIPSQNKDEANHYADVILPTGLDVLRNGLVVDADAVIAIGGGAGTLSEIAIAWQKFKLVIAMTGVDGWSSKLAGKPIDHRIRYPGIPEDCIYPATSVEEAIRILEEKLSCYTRRYHGIKWRNTK